MWLKNNNSVRDMTVNFDSLAARLLLIVKCRWVIEPSRNMKSSSPQQNVSCELRVHRQIVYKSLWRPESPGPLSGRNEEDRTSSWLVLCQQFFLDVLIRNTTSYWVRPSKSRTLNPCLYPFRYDKSPKTIPGSSFLWKVLLIVPT